MAETDFPTGSGSSQIGGFPVDLTGHAAGDALILDPTNTKIISSASPPGGVDSVSFTAPLSNTGTARAPVGALTGDIALARIATALATGGDPITGTVLAASTRTETPTIGTALGTQHALPAGTAALLAADSALPAANLSGDVAQARISVALAAGGVPIAGTVLTASTRTETPTVGTSSATQHALPAGTADVLTADSTATVTNKNIDAGQLTGDVAVARIATALAAGGNPITGTIVDATTRMDAPSIGTDSSNQHAFPSGTGTLLDANTPGIHTTVDVQRFATPGTFTLSFPVGAVWVDIYAQHSGSGGGSGRRGANPADGGGAGAAGDLTPISVPRSLFGTSETLVIGDGGLGGAAITMDSINGNNGLPGDNSTLTIMGVPGFVFLGAGQVAAASSQGGQGGTSALAGVAGGSSGFGMIAGNSGRGGGGGTTGIPAPPGNGLGYDRSGAGEGGGGGAYNGSTHDGAQGGHGAWLAQAFSNGGVAGGAVNGSDGAVFNLNFGGSGGGGGASTGDGVTPAGKGGNGIQGGGGGGGGGALNGANSGAGGKGGASFVLVRCLCIN